MDPKTVVLVTGANTGLGFEMVKSLYSSETAYEVLVCGRSLVKAEQAAITIKNDVPSTCSRLWPMQVNIEDDESIQSIFTEVQTKFGRLDALINNAGMIFTLVNTTYTSTSNTNPGGQFDQQLLAGNLTMREVWNASWNVNTVGTQVMTATFLPLLLKSEDPRLLFMTSGTSTLQGTENFNLPINKVPAAGWPKKTPTAVNNIPAYRSSKCGMNMMMRGALDWTIPREALLILSFSLYRMVPYAQGRWCEGMVHLARLPSHRTRWQPGSEQKSWCGGSSHSWRVCKERLGRAERRGRGSRSYKARCAAMVSSSAYSAKDESSEVLFLLFSESIENSQDARSTANLDYCTNLFSGHRLT